MRARGRPRSFDTEAAQQSIMQVFWRKGYAATSLDEIASATGLSRPSLYGAFGDKLDMYLMSLSLFAQHMVRTALSALDKGRTLKTALIGFYGAVIEVYTGDQKDEAGLGCMVFANALADAPTNDRIRQAVNSFLDDLHTDLADRLRALAPQASKGEIRIAATLAASNLINLAVHARAGADRKTLVQMSRDTAKAIDQVLSDPVR